MSYRWTQLSPQSTDGGSLKISVPGAWSGSDKFRDMQFLRSWLELDSQVEVRRGSVWGLALIVGISTGFWTGMVFLIARLFA